MEVPGPRLRRRISAWSGGGPAECSGVSWASARTWGVLVNWDVTDSRFRAKICFSGFGPCTARKHPGNTQETGGPDPGTRAEPGNLLQDKNLQR